MSDDKEVRGTGRAGFGPIILSSWRRRGWTIVGLAWLALAVLILMRASYGLLWFPVLGMLGCSSVLVRDRAGRRRWAAMAKLADPDHARPRDL